MRLPSIVPRQIVMPLVVLVCGALVIYPIAFLINESLNVGDPSTFPPEQYGLDNFTNLTRRLSRACQHAAGLLHRDRARGDLRLSSGLDSDTHQHPRPPAARTTDGAAVLHDAADRRARLGRAAGTEDRPGQSGLALTRRTGRSVQHLLGLRHRLGDGAVRGHRRVRHDLGGDEIDGPIARGKLSRTGRRQAAHRAAHHTAVGRAWRAQRHHLRVRRDAGLVRRCVRAGNSRPLLRGHHGDLAGHAVIPARLWPRRGDGPVAVRRHADHADARALRAEARHLHHHHRQGIPPARDGCRCACAGRCSPSPGATSSSP